MGRRVRILLFPLISIALLALIAGSNWALMSRDSGSVIHVWVDSLLAGQPGPGEINNSVWYPEPDIELLPGDLLLGGYPKCSYGRYTHAALYVGEGEGIEAFMDLGVVRQDMAHFRTYAHYAILRPIASEEVKAAAIDYAESKTTGVFFPLAFKRDDRYWNCSKIMWKAYAEQGIDLDPVGDLWIAPEGFAQSPLVEVLYER